MTLEASLLNLQEDDMSQRLVLNLWIDENRGLNTLSFDILLDFRMSVVK